jgi:hypothetical protein
MSAQEGRLFLQNCLDAKLTVTCRMIHTTSKTGSRLDDWIY